VDSIGNDPIEGAGFVLHVPVERRIVDVDQRRHTTEVGRFVTSTGAPNDVCRTNGHSVSLADGRCLPTDRFPTVQSPLRDYSGGIRLWGARRPSPSVSIPLRLGSPTRRYSVHVRMVRCSPAMRARSPASRSDHHGRVVEARQNGAFKLTETRYPPLWFQLGLAIVAASALRQPNRCL
jgi:hypothetical protein